MSHPLPFDRLFVVSPIKFDGEDVNEAFYSEKAGKEVVKFRMQYGARLVEDGWQISSQPALSVLKVSTEAQGKEPVWVLIDQDHGNPEDRDGRLFVFCFRSESKAEKYKKALDEKRARVPDLIQVTKPYSLWLH